MNGKRGEDWELKDRSSFHAVGMAHPHSCMLLLSYLGGGSSCQVKLPFLLVCLSWLPASAALGHNLWSVLSSSSGRSPRSVQQLRPEQHWQKRAEAALKPDLQDAKKISSTMLWQSCVASCPSQGIWAESCLALTSAKGISLTSSTFRPFTGMQKYQDQQRGLTK